jgi:hypothetical protein
MAAWRETHREHIRMYQRRWRERARQDADAQIRLRARWAVRDALRRGVLTRPLRCSRCGVDPGVDELGRSRLEAHHHDPRDALAVQWLCKRPCHLEVDLALKRGAA